MFESLLPGHRDEGDYDEPSHDIDWGHNIEFPKHHTWLEYPEIDDEAPFRKTKDIIEDPNKGIMTLEERQPVKRSIRIRNKQRAKDPKYRKGLEELADLV
ncbi:unnamed protein product [Rodentolepis nana]|uniref:Uncharacterized protein n=1 Tax=Rodentolepis nana TaxID=102285 RepID=A0A3P7V1Y9_RODNA|nr:unnamed protein product [Rodentolepis nana]